MLMGSTVRVLLLAAVCAAMPGPAVEARADDVDSRHYELRIYHVAPDKLDALQSRFRDHALALLEKHGFASIGYWTPMENAENLLVFIIASPDREAHDNAWKSFAADPEWAEVVKTSEAGGKLVEKVESIHMKATDFSPAIAPSGGDQPRCFELRTYEAAPGKLGALLSRFRDHTVALFTKHGMEHIGYWTGTEEGSHRLLYILAHKDRESAAESFKNFRADPDWIAAKANSETDGSLTAKVESLFMTPLDFSPIK